MFVWLRSSIETMEKTRYDHFSICWQYKELKTKEGLYQLQFSNLGTAKLQVNVIQNNGQIGFLEIPTTGSVLKELHIF